MFYSLIFKNSNDKRVVWKNTVNNLKNIYSSMIKDMLEWKYFPSNAVFTALHHWSTDNAFNDIWT